MEYQGILTLQALADLKKIEANSRKQGAADPAGYCKKLFGRSRELQEMPLRGGPIHHDPDLRYPIEGQYFIIYRVFAARQIVKALRFWHSARDVFRLRA